MPLKHHTESAYILFLALITAVSGFVASLLPHSEAGLQVWSLCMTLSVFYPLVLSRTFRDNRADYEFRALHWFPAAIFFLWIFFYFTGSLAKIFHILELGLFFLWSLPLVALAVAFLILFSLHVLRRWVPRVAVLSLLLLVFTSGALAAEAWNVNHRIQRFAFSEQSKFTTYGRDLVHSVSKAFRSAIMAPTTTDEGTLVASDTSSSQSASLTPAEAQALQMQSSLPPAIAEKKPRGLSASGPEDVFVLFLTLAAIYSITLHVRAKRRIEA